VKGRSPRPLDDGGQTRRVARVRQNHVVEIRPAGWDDLEQVVELLREHNRVASGLAGVLAAQIHSEWKLPSFKVGRDNLVAANGDVLLGYAALSSAQGVTIASVDQKIADELLVRIAARARNRGFRLLQVVVGSTDERGAALVHRHPFVLDSNTILMWRSLATEVAEPRWPSGVTVRTYQPGDSRSVHRLLDDAYRAWDRRYSPMTHDDWVTWMTGDVEFDPDLWWLAESDGELAGCALHWSGGWLKDIAVRMSDRGRGIGTALVAQGLNEFAERGVGRVGLKVDADNPTGAISMYEKLGFVAHSQQAIWSLSL
jgi:mycothiol synthase